jgi:hypothetical protein
LKRVFSTITLNKKNLIQMKKSKSTETEAVLENPNITEETQSETAQNPAEKEMSALDQLINKRTGFWEIGLEEADVKWIRNQCNSKFQFVGPNEAFMLMNCYLGFASAVARLDKAAKEGLKDERPVVQAAAIEACAMLINRFEGTGLESAQRVFRIAIALNGPITEMKNLDKQIEQLKNAGSEN